MHTCSPAKQQWRPWAFHYEKLMSFLEVKLRQLWWPCPPLPSDCYPPQVSPQSIHMRSQQATALVDSSSGKNLPGTLRVLCLSIPKCGICPENSA